MAATFSKAGVYALPCELMSGCSFAEDFWSQTKCEDDNFATLQGTGHSFDNGVTLDGNGYLEYDKVKQDGSFSVVVRFATTTTPAFDILVNNSGLWTDGFFIHVEPGVVKATLWDGNGLVYNSVNASFADGEIHTLTYVVDITNSQNHLYVDSLAVDTQSTGAVSGIGSSGNLVIGGTSGGYEFTGTIYKVRIFDSALTEAEHDLYHADTLTDFYDSPLAVYRCDSVCNDTVGNYVWDRTTNLNDLAKADRTTSAKFPTFDTHHYEFDGSDDYLSGLMTLPAAYTITAVRNDSNPWDYPYIQQDNDTAFTDLITTEGDYEGWLHSLIIHTGTLAQIQKYHDEYQQLYWVDRCWAWGIYHRLITEGTCRYLGFYNKAGALRDWSGTLNGPSVHDVTLSSTTGATFNNSDSCISFSHNSDLSSEQGTISVYGDFSSNQTCVILDKGTNYKLYTDGLGKYIHFNSSKISYDFSSNPCEVISVTYKDGYKPRFYIDDGYIGDGDATVTVDDTDTTAFVVGNNNELNDDCEYTIKHVYLGDRPLTDYEINALYVQRDIYGSANNMAKNYVQYTDTGTTGAIDWSIDGGDDFDIPLLTIQFDSAPTSAGSITIKLDAEAGADYDCTIHTINPVGSTSVVVENMMGFQYGDKVQVDYANPDSRDYFCVANVEL